MLRRRWLALLLPWLVLIVFPLATGALPASANNAVVNAPCDQAAFEAALAGVQTTGGGTLTFNCGGAATITFTGAKTITSAVTIAGADLITLDGGQFDRLFYVDPAGRLTLSHLTLVNGYSFSSDGGAVYNSGVLIVDHATFRDNHTNPNASGGAIASEGTLTVTNSLFETNRAGNGGALYPRWNGSRTYLRDTIFRGNYTLNTSNGWGGALFIWDGAVVVIDGGTFYSNTARAGGAIYNSYPVVASSLRVTDTLFQDNRGTVQSGGALYSEGLLLMTGGELNGNVAANLGGGAYVTNTAEFSGTRFSGNQAFRGGGLYVDQAYVNLTNLTVSGNQGTHNGGGVYTRGNLQLTNVAVSGNQAGAGGGGLYLDQPASLIWGTTILFRSTVTGNTAQDGGGLYLYASVLSSIDSTLSHNAADRGAGLSANSATLIMARSTLASNRANSYGGGLALNFADAQLENVTISGNSAGTSGGGLRTFSTGPTRLRNVTVAYNSAPTGGGLQISAGPQGLTLTNTLIAYSLAGGNCSGSPAAANYSLSSDLICVLTGAGNQTNTDPLLTGLGNYGGYTPVHMLKLGSPARDGVVGSDAPSVDQRNKPRPVAPGFDIGAVERQPGDVELIPWVRLPFVVR